MDSVLWIVLGVLLAIAEIFTTTLFLVMFAVGAFAAAGAAALGAPVTVQALVFTVVSALTVAVVRPTIRRHRAEADAAVPLGIAGMVGSPAEVLERVDASGGLVKVDGELWSARSYDGTQVFAPGEQVRVIEVKGATALVWREDTSHL